MSLRSRRPQVHVNHERWMVSFADFMTLLFALFVVLFAISAVDEKKLEQVSESMEQAFGVMQPQGPQILDGHPEVVRPIPPIVPPAQAPDTPAGTAQKELVGRLEKVLNQTQKLAAAVQLRRESRGVVIQLKDSGIFDSGSAALRPELLNELKQVVRELESLNQPLRIEGHTDNVPVRGGGYASNWELSAARATSVLQFFLAQSRLSPEQMSVAGYGEYRPIAPNTTAQGRARNRRVDIVILNPQALENEPVSTESGPSLNQQLNQKLQQRSF